MADGTHIEWSEATWNIVTGCAVLTPGCTNCYAMRLAGTRLQHHKSRRGLTKPSKAGPVWTGEIRFNEQWLKRPLRWTKPRRIFVAAHGDLFHEGVPDEMIDRIFAVMALCPQHTFQVLTKRAERMRDYMTDDDSVERVFDEMGKAALKADFPEGKLPYRDQMIAKHGLALPNIWAGVSVEDQRRADERIPLLLQTPAAVRWISAEPLLGPVDLHSLICRETGSCPTCPACLQTLDWVVIGGESGPGARPFSIEWARSIIAQCKAAGVPVFMKQLGARPYNYPGEFRPYIGHLGLNHRKGGDPAEWPEDLRIRGYPDERLDR